MPCAIVVPLPGVQFRQRQKGLARSTDTQWYKLHHLQVVPVVNLRGQMVPAVCADTTVGAEAGALGGTTSLSIKEQWSVESGEFTREGSGRA